MENKPMFRDLYADEIECRVAQAAQNGVSLLLYKDARCDQNILDETVGPMSWMRQHTRDNANCFVSIWDENKQMWVGKEDTGTESNTEKEKGLASDSFKRACFNWGIGRELYTAPFIWVPASACEKLEKDDRSGKWKCNDKFEVASIAIENKKIVGLSIRNSKTRKVVYTMGKTAPEPSELPKKAEKPTFKKAETISDDGICSCCGKPVANLMQGGVVKKTAAEVIKWTQETFGKTMCWSCAKKEMDNREAS